MLAYYKLSDLTQDMACIVHIIEKNAFESTTKIRDYCHSMAGFLSDIENSLQQQSDFSKSVSLQKAVHVGISSRRGNSRRRTGIPARRRRKHHGSGQNEHNRVSATPSSAAALFSKQKSPRNVVLIGQPLFIDPQLLIQKTTVQSAKEPVIYDAYKDPRKGFGKTKRAGGLSNSRAKLLTPAETGIVLKTEIGSDAVDGIGGRIDGWLLKGMQNAIAVKKVESFGLQDAVSELEAMMSTGIVLLDHEKRSKGPSHGKAGRVAKRRRRQRT